MTGESVYVPGARDLCTIDDVVGLVPGYDLGDDTDTDETLGELVTLESLDFQETTGREIVKMNAVLARVFRLDTWDVAERELLIGDASTVTAVVITRPDGTPWQTLDPTAWVEFEHVSRRESWRPITSLQFPQQVTTPALLQPADICTVTGTWGFPEIPVTVLRAVARMTIVRYLTDVAAAGTAFADAVNQAEFNIGAAIRLAFDARRRIATRILPRSGVKA